jgi:hypothetical protein
MWGTLLGRVRYDAVIKLFFWGGRGKEKLWVPILHRLTIIKLNSFSQPCFFPSCFFPSYSYYEVIEALASLQALGNPASRLSIQLNIAVVATRLNVVLAKTGITIYGIDSNRSPCAFVLFRCGHLQHRMWPKATKSMLNPYACAN